MEWTEKNTHYDVTGLESQPVDFGIVDDKGRAVGGYATISKAASTLPHLSGLFYVRTYATRAGRQFGAAFPKATTAISLEAAKKLGEKKLIAARKRAEKNFPTTGAQ